MNIASLCNREVVGIDAEASLHEAAALMCEEHVGALVVVTTDQPPKVVGLLTDRDLALDVLGRMDGSAELRVGHIAKSPPLAVQGTADLREAALAMQEGGVRRLLVVDDDGGVIGLVSADDLLAAMAEDLEVLSRALRSGITREKAQRRVATVTAGRRMVFPSFGSAAAQ
jgi:CBS domain-containing protein